MTIGIQNEINARYSKALPDEGSVEVSVHLSEGTVSRVSHYLDDHRDMSWDAVVEAAIKSFLPTTP